MRAIHCVQFGEPRNLLLIERDEPVAAPGEVLVAVEAAGLGFADALNVRGAYQVKRPLPFIPGGEMAGRVVGVGEGVPRHWLGRRVMALSPHGSLAERVALPAALCTPIPDALSAETAAGCIVNYCTALYALETCGQLRAGETVLVLGAAGGLGLAALDVAKALGAQVAAAASSPEKLHACAALGADWTVDYSRPDWRKALAAALDKRPLNVVVDPVGGPYSETAFRCLAPGGRHLVLGFAAGEIPRIPLNLPLLKRASIVGVDWGGSHRSGPPAPPPELERLLALVTAAKIHPAAQATYPLAQAGEVLQGMLERRGIGKAVIRVSSDP
jgi:NADPH2:quinone reductase